jgi:hypothetical protein
MKLNHEIFESYKKEKDGTYTLVFNKECSKNLKDLMEKNDLSEEQMTEIFSKMLSELRNKDLGSQKTKRNKKVTKHDKNK